MARESDTKQKTKDNYIWKLTQNMTARTLTNRTNPLEMGKYWNVSEIYKRKKGTIKIVIKGLHGVVITISVINKW